jgi:site-specific recombinase XerD
MTTSTVGSVLHAFFCDYLTLQKGLRPNSLRSYGDAMRLFLLFAANDVGCKITRLSLDDLTADRVCRFLNSLEETRKNSVRSRNQRLASLRAFFEYLGRQRPERLTLAQQVAAIPNKRTQPGETFFLERDDIEALFANMPLQGRFALRDRTLLLFLYNTGARVQEAADLRAANLEFGSHPRVHLHGKGNKWRVCPLWAETAALLRRLLDQVPSNHPVFASGQGRALTRFGIYKLVRRHARPIAKHSVNGQSKAVSPHIFRHTTAVHLLEAGVEINVIRGWLGHVSLETTNRYAEITIRTKEQALTQCSPPITGERFRPHPWRNDVALLNWLQSL